MYSIEGLTTYCIQKAQEYPELKEDIYGLLCLCKDEIADGGSPQHEIDLCFEDIEQYITEYNEGKS